MTRKPSIPAPSRLRCSRWLADVTDDAVSSALWAIALELLYSTSVLYRPFAPLVASAAEAPTTVGRAPGPPGPRLTPAGA